MVAVESVSSGQWFNQVIDLLREQVSPVDDIPGLADFLEKSAGIGPHVCVTCFEGKQHLPRLNDESASCPHGKVWSRGHLEFP